MILERRDGRPFGKQRRVFLIYRFVEFPRECSFEIGIHPPWRERPFPAIWQQRVEVVRAVVHPTDGANHPTRLLLDL